MKRDWDLFREILISAAEDGVDKEIFRLNSYDQELVAQYIEEMNGEYLNATDVTHNDSETQEFIINGLNSQGAELFNLINNDKEWQDIKNIIIQKRRDLAIEKLAKFNIK